MGLGPGRDPHTDFSDDTLPGPGPGRDPHTDFSDVTLASRVSDILQTLVL